MHPQVAGKVVAARIDEGLLGHWLSISVPPFFFFEALLAETTFTSSTLGTKLRSSGTKDLGLNFLRVFLFVVGQFLIGHLFKMPSAFAAVPLTMVSFLRALQKRSADMVLIIAE